ncbi:polyphenol oxidase I, chloroplastic-like [Wolffia australiana]
MAGLRRRQLTLALLSACLLIALWFSQDKFELRSSSVHGGSLLTRPLAANLSSCHVTVNEINLPTYCCPPIRDEDQLLFNFDLSKLSQTQKRVRRAVHHLDANYIAKYQKAVAMMKSLPSDHPHSFLSQANNHCLYCTGSYDQVNSSSLFKIHRSWLFFPWHRAYLFFHERILGKLLGDESFALPYWSWDSPEGMQIPGVYFNGTLYDGNRDRAHLPPTIADLNYDDEESDRPPEEDVARNLAFMYNQIVSGAKKKELFLGCKLTAGEEGFCDGPGTVEAGPHNPLHSWLGTPRNPAKEDMGAFYAAARDPIFYAHHSNVDRMWAIWKELREGKDADFEDPAWLDSAFTFYDENLRFVRIKVRDLLDAHKLGYEYEKIPLPWLNAKPKPTASSAASLRKRKSVSLLSRRAAMEKEQALVSSVTFEVYRPKRGRSKEEKEREEEIIVVEGIRVKRDVYAKFDVFVNLGAEEEKIAGPLAREFAGSFVNTPHGARRIGETEGKMGKKGTTLKLGISELLEDLGADEDESIWVSLVPRGGSGAFITVDGVRIEFLR